MMQQQMNEELHRQTLDVLVKLVDVLTCDELALICWHCGVSTNELMPVAPVFQRMQLEDVRYPELLKSAA